MSDEEQRRKVRSLQNWLVVLAIVVVFLGIAAPTAVIVYTNVTALKTQTTIICQNARAHIEELEGLRRISHALGLPALFRIPPLPEECESI